MTNPFQLIIPLKQHTPIIHFQHYTDGATLRASEVKPALDSFLIKYFEKQQMKWQKWRIGDKPALDYKLSFENVGLPWIDYIEQPKLDDAGDFEQVFDRNLNDEKTKTDAFPGYFANMGRNYYKPKDIKRFVLFKNVQLKLFSLHSDLKKQLESDDCQLFTDFFATHNFGSRKNRGFGSYLPEGKTVSPALFNYFIDVEIPAEDDERELFTKLFRHIDLFARVLRGGVNLKAGPPHNQRDVLYLKSFLFSYFKDEHKIQWEKKAIKKKYLGDALEEQKATRPRSEALTYESKNVKLVKDLLGLATEESWLSYGKKFEKIEARKEGDNFIEKKQEDRIERAPSPILYKPLEIGPGRYRVYILLVEESLLTGKAFLIDRPGTGRGNWGLETPDKFSLVHFFNYIMENKNQLLDSMRVYEAPRNQEDKIIRSVFNSLNVCQ